jgi:hypothetical protein
MLNKFYAFGLLASALFIAPTAAFAGDQVAGSSTNITQTSITTGGGNVSGQSSDALTLQRQIKNAHPFCGGTNNQIAASNSTISQGSAIAGVGNVSGQAGSSNTVQSQVATSRYCSYIYPF